MEKKYLYFQPEYVSRFQCVGGKCPRNCCMRGWTIEIDQATYNQYLRLKPEAKAREITRHFRYDAALGKHFVKENPCAFLDEDKLCRLQRELGEKFLSATCVTYPRYTRDFGRFFERVLTLSCPIAAEMGGSRKNSFVRRQNRLGTGLHAERIRYTHSGNSNRNDLNFAGAHVVNRPKINCAWIFSR